MPHKLTRQVLACHQENTVKNILASLVILCHHLFCLDIGTSKASLDLLRIIYPVNILPILS